MRKRKKNTWCKQVVYTGKYPVVTRKSPGNTLNMKLKIIQKKREKRAKLKIKLYRGVDKGEYNRVKLKYNDLDQYVRWNHFLIRSSTEVLSTWGPVGKWIPALQSQRYIWKTNSRTWCHNAALGIYVSYNVNCWRLVRILYLIVERKCFICSLKYIFKMYV